MSNSNDLKIVLAQTRDQLLAPVRITMDGIKGIPRHREIRRKLNNLTDPTLLDRMSRLPYTIPVQGEQEPEQVPVRILRKPKSIDGILGLAV